MGLKDKIIENLDKMGGVCDVNTNQYYHMQEYKEALQFAQKYQTIAGVPEEIKNLKENHNKYRKNFNDALNQVYDEWNQKHRTWMRVNTAKKPAKEDYDRSRCHSCCGICGKWNHFVAAHGGNIRND